MLWFALHLSALPLEALLAALPALPETGGSGPARCVVEQRRVLLVDSRARLAGVLPGMSAASAAALLPGLQMLARDSAREAAFVERLALALARYTPAVVIEPDGVLLEVAASLRLFGGARALSPALRATVRASGVQAVQIAVAPTAGAASLLARLQPARTPPPRRPAPHRSDAAVSVRSDAALAVRSDAAIPSRREAAMPGRSDAGVPGRSARPAVDAVAAWHQHTRRRLDALPLAAALAAWQLPERTAGLLHGIGCRTLADARALPRAGLQRRAGGALLERLAEAYGEAPDPRTWFTPPPGFQIGIELLQRADDAAMLVFAAERLVQPLAGWLAQQWLAASRIALHLRHEASRHQALPDTVVCIGLGQASRDAKQIGLLLRERLQRTVLPAPVYALTLKLEEAVSHAGCEAALWRDPQRPGDEDCRGLIDRLGARLGPERVQRLQLRADHRPERAMALGAASAVAGGAGVAEPPPPTLARPTWLLPEPLALTEQDGRPVHGGPLTLASRAERIEAGWFDGEPVSRDYHVAEGRDHRLRWVFRERRGAASQWYLHGLFG